MDSHLYDQKLAGHKIFKDLKGCLDDNPSGKLRNLLDLNDDVLFVWNPSENCLWCLNLKQLEENGDETPYQKLHFLSPPAFSVERVMSSPCGSRVCVWGARGVSVAELPTRWGRGGLFETTNHTVLCKSCTLDERFLYSQGEVRRVHWHPSSLSHVLVLVSDNTIRLYNIAVKSGPKLVRVTATGAKPSSLLAGRTLLESLGDTAVDFTPLPRADTLLVLRGNGDVYSMDVELDGKNPLDCPVRGPLPMFPPADDNYGSESCCITALGTRNAPPLVVVATASAALYHCLLLPDEVDDEEGGHALYVLEAVELNSTDDVLHSYPVHLYPCSSNSYAVVHAGGVHTVTLPMLSQLVDYAMADEAESESMVSALCSGRSSARHLVRLAPPAAGLALTPRPLSHLLVMTTQADLLPRLLEPFDLEEQLYKEMQLRNPALEQDDINSLLKERQKLPFTSIIQEILAREVSQPILSMGKRDEPPPKESLELLWSVLVRLRSEYMCRQTRACGALADKLRALRALARTHSECLQNLQSDVDEVRQQSTALKEKCILAEKHQDDLKYRCSSVIRAWGSRGMSPAERQLLAELVDARHRSDALQDRLRQSRLQAHRRIEELKKWEEDYKRKDVALGKSHSDTIASILQQQEKYTDRMLALCCFSASETSNFKLQGIYFHRLTKTSQISSLIEETKLLKDQLSIV